MSVCAAKNTFYYRHVFNFWLQFQVVSAAVISQIAIFSNAVNYVYRGDEKIIYITFLKSQFVFFRYKKACSSPEGKQSYKNNFRVFFWFVL